MASITKTKAVNLVVNKIDKTNFDSMRTAGTITDTMAADELWMGDGRLVSDNDLTAHTGDSNIHTTAAEKAKLSGIAAGANNYTHPSSHPPSIITQDASNRFVTDTEKATWNAKETTAGAQAKVDAHIAVKTNPHAVTKAQVGLGSVNDYGVATQAEAEAGTSNVKYMTPLSTKQAITKAVPVNATTSVSGLMSSTDKSKLDGVATGANNYIHPETDGNLHVPATGTTNSGKVLKAGSTAGSLSWGTLTAADVGAAPTSHTHSYVPTTTTVNGKALSANIAITAADVSAYSKAEIDGKIVDNLTTGGATNVLSAEQGKALGASVSQLQSSISNINVSWDGITGKPTTFTPSAHSHNNYIQMSADGSASYLNGVDLNNTVVTGIYRGTNCSNQPALTAGWFYLNVISHGSTWVYQEMIDLHNSSIRFIRHRYEGTWTAWTDPFGIVVNGKQAVVNAINGSLGYASGLTTSHTHDDYAWWIQNKVATRFFNTITPKTVSAPTINTAYTGRSTLNSGSMQGSASITLRSIPVTPYSYNCYMIEFDWNLVVESGVVYIPLSPGTGYTFVVPGGKLYTSTRTAFASSPYWAFHPGTYTKCKFMLITYGSAKSSIEIPFRFSNISDITGMPNQTVTYNLSPTITNLRVYEVN